MVSSTVNLGAKILTANEVLVLLANVVDDRASHLHLGQQVEVSQNEVDLAILFELRAHEVLVDEEVVRLVLLARVASRVVNLVVVPVIPVSQVEHLVPNLQHVQGEVDLREFEVERAQFLFLVGLLAVWRLGGGNLEGFVDLHQFSFNNGEA